MGSKIIHWPQTENELSNSFCDLHCHGNIRSSAVAVVKVSPKLLCMPGSVKGTTCWIQKPEMPHDLLQSARCKFSSNIACFSTSCQNTLLIPAWMCTSRKAQGGLSLAQTQDSGFNCPSVRKKRQPGWHPLFPPQSCLCPPGSTSDQVKSKMPSISWGGEQHDLQLTRKVSSHALVRLPAGEACFLAAGSSLHLLAGYEATMGFLPQEAESPGLAVIYVLRALLVVIFLLFP